MPVSLAEKLLLGRSESGLLRSALLIIMDAVYGHSNGSDGLPEKLDDSQRAALDREETGRSGFVLFWADLLSDAHAIGLYMSQ